MTQRESRPRTRTRIAPMTPGIPRAARIRAYLAGVTITLGLVGVAWRAWAVQVDDNEHYRALADRQHAMTVRIPAPRGEIRDRHGAPLAVSADADSIWANPMAIKDVTSTADKLARLMHVDAAVLEAKLGTGKKFVWLDRHVDASVAAAVKAAKLPGIEIAKEPKRWYPAGALAGSVIGRADIDGNGLDGIELAMNEHLTGTRGAGHAVRDARGRRTFADGLAQPEQGATVKLTLDRNIQAITQGALTESVLANKAASGVAVVVEVATGHVLGMATYPVYDPNRPEGVGNARNRPVTDAFEAGSVMKLFTVAAALDAEVVQPHTGFDVHGGSMMVPGRRTPIKDTHYDKYLTTSEIIKRSSNVGSVKIALLLGKARLHQYLTKFGFGAKTRIELPGEQSGVLRPHTKWRDVEFVTMAFGYGLTVTPIQLGAALAAIGNDGIYNAPRIVDEVRAADGRVVWKSTPEPRRAIQSQTATELRTMMGTVFEGGKLSGTAASIVVPGFHCGGKTGTAHKWDPVAKQYSPSNYLSSFVGLAPLANPRLAIVVLVDDPAGGDYYGGKVAGPVFATIASESLRYLGVPGTTLQCEPAIPNARLLDVLPPKTCTIPPPKAKPAVKPDGNSPNSPTPHARPTPG